MSLLHHCLAAAAADCLQVKELAPKELRLVGEVPFEETRFEGYTHKATTQADRTHGIAMERSVTYVWRKAEVRAQLTRQSTHKQTIVQVGCPCYPPPCCPPPLIVRLDPHETVPLRMSLTYIVSAYYALARTCTEGWRRRWTVQEEEGEVPAAKKAKLVSKAKAKAEQKLGGGEQIKKKNNEKIQKIEAVRLTQKKVLVGLHAAIKP
eukprot:6837563-Pyramimonas_sp.AAC.2